MAKTSAKQISTFIVEKDTKGLSFGKAEHKVSYYYIFYYFFHKFVYKMIKFIN